MAIAVGSRRNSERKRAHGAAGGSEASRAGHPQGRRRYGVPTAENSLLFVALAPIALPVQTLTVWREADFLGAWKDPVLADPHDLLGRRARAFATEHGPTEHETAALMLPVHDKIPSQTLRLQAQVCVTHNSCLMRQALPIWIRYARIGAHQTLLFTGRPAPAALDRVNPPLPRPVEDGARLGEHVLPGRPHVVHGRDAVADAGEVPEAAERDGRVLPALEDARLALAQGVVGLDARVVEEQCVWSTYFWQFEHENFSCLGTSPGPAPESA